MVSSSGDRIGPSVSVGEPICKSCKYALPEDWLYALAMVLPPASSLDRDALRQGFAIAGGIAVPLAIVAGLVAGSDDQRSGLRSLFSLIVLVALFAGAFIAARRQQMGTPLTHGMIVAVAVAVTVSIIRTLRRALDGNGPGAGIITNVLFGLLCGLFGGLAGSRRNRKDAVGPTS